MHSPANLIVPAISVVLCPAVPGITVILLSRAGTCLRCDRASCWLLHPSCLSRAKGCWQSSIAQWSDIAKLGTQNQEMEIAIEFQNLDVFCMGTMRLPSTQKPGNKVLCLIHFSPVTCIHAYTSFIFWVLGIHRG